MAHGVDGYNRIVDNAALRNKGGAYFRLKSYLIAFGFSKTKKEGKLEVKKLTPKEMKALKLKIKARVVLEKKRKIMVSVVTIIVTALFIWLLSEVYVWAFF